MSDLDALLDRGRHPGAFVERRRFTLSRDKAIAKIREFSLRHPEQYILELIQGAVFAGADHIAIDTRPQHMLIAFVGGRALTLDQLEGLFDYLFTDRTDPETRHLVQLAIGVNAILQRKPRRLRIESGDGTAAGSVRLDLDAEGTGTIGRPDRTLVGTYLLVEHPGAWLPRFGARRLTEEQQLIETRCMYTPVPILVNTDAPFGYRSSRQISLFGVPDEQAFDTGGRRGVFALAAQGAVRPGVRLVIGGVWVNTQALPQLGQALLARDGGAKRPVMGVICDDLLRKTADQSDVVQDRPWHEMIHAVQPHATALLKRTLGERYTPPELAPLPPRQEAEPGGPRGPLAEALSAQVRRLGRLGGVAVRALRALPSDTQVFWVQPDAESLLAEVGDPSVFPRLVLVLRPGQALTLAEQAPQLRLGRLTTAADVEFVRTALARRDHHAEVDVGLSHGSVQGLLTLRFQLAGDRPSWGLSRPDIVPACVVRGRKTEALLALPVDLPGVSALLRLTDDGDDVPESAALAQLVDREAWRLLDAVPGMAHEPAARALLLLVVSRHARQFLVRTGADVACVPALPPSWGALGERALRTPLLETEDGPRSLEEVAAQDTDHTPRPGVSWRDFEALELRFCPGRVAWPGLATTLIVGVCRGPRRWACLGPGQQPGAAVRAIVAVGATATATARALPEWTRLPHPAPGVQVLLRPGVEDAVDWQAGHHALYDHLLDRSLADRWSDLVTPVISEARAVTLCRQALVDLAVHLGRSDTGPMLQASDGDHRRPLQEWRGRRDFRVAPREGARVTEPDTVLLDPGELAALERIHGPLPLRFDDPPVAWSQLAEPSRDAWLVRQEVLLDGVRGWLGLRHPHDATSAILMEHDGGLQALPRLEAQVPCHGLLRLEHGRSELTAAQLAMLRLSGLQLYQRLAGGEGDADPDRAASAWRYGATFVLAAWARGGGRALTGAAARLSRQLTLPGAHGTSWGTLERWLLQPDHQRPALPDGLVLPPLAQTPAPVARVDRLPILAAQEQLESVLGELGSPLQVLLMSESRRSKDLVRLDLDASHSGLAVLLLNTRQPLLAKALAHETGQQILLLELAREVAGLAQRQGRFLDLKTLHRALLARRLAAQP